MGGILYQDRTRNRKVGAASSCPKALPANAPTRSRLRQPTAVAETPAAPQPPAQPQGRRGRGNEFLFPPTGAQVQCPSCGTPYVVPIFSIIDFGANPELLGALLGGQVNMAVCPSCGVGGPLSAPLMVHDPAHEYLGVYTPPTGMDDIQRQKLIGDLTQALMRRLPQEARRGYMLTPKQYMDWQRFMEKFWEFQGVTPEMLRRQSLQSQAIQSLVGLADDPAALDIAIERNRSLIDRSFFALLDRLLMMVTNQGDQNTAQQMLALRSALLEKTEAGREIKALQDKVRTLIAGIAPSATREDVLEALLNAWQGDDGREVASSAAVALAPMLDYQFLLAIAHRLEQNPDAETAAKLEELRALVHGNAGSAAPERPVRRRPGAGDAPGRARSGRSHRGAPPVRRLHRRRLPGHSGRQHRSGRKEQRRRRCPPPARRSTTLPWTSSRNACRRSCAWSTNWSTRPTKPPCASCWRKTAACSTAILSSRCANWKMTSAPAAAAK